MVSSVSSPGKAVVTPAAEARIIYVSASTGDDTNDGLSPDFPVKTITRGEQLVRDRSPDWLLLKRGDRWQVGLDDWHKRGRSAEQPMIIGAYGTGSRPLMKSATANAPELSLEFVTVIGVQFIADARLRAAAASASRWNHGVPPAPGSVRRAGDAQPAPRPGHSPIVTHAATSPRPQPGRSTLRPPSAETDSDSIEWPIQIPSREETPDESTVPPSPAPASDRPARAFYDIASIVSVLPSPAEALRPVRLQPAPIAPANTRLAPHFASKSLGTVAPLAPLAQRLAQRSQSQAQSLRVKRIILGSDDASITVFFTASVAEGVDRTDLLLQSSDGAIIDSTALAVTCDPTGGSATWTFPGLPGKVLPAGSWRVTLRAAITDTQGRQLDGMEDGIGGDDFHSPHRLVSKGTPPPAAQRTCVEPLPRRAAA
jgi:hypothetical protein